MLNTTESGRDLQSTPEFSSNIAWAGSRISHVRTEKVRRSRPGTRGGARPCRSWAALTRGSCFCGEHGSYFGAANSFAKLGRDRAMATKAKGSNVIQVALAAAFRYRQNVIGIPQTFAYLALLRPQWRIRAWRAGAARTLQPGRAP